MTRKLSKLLIMLLIMLILLNSSANLSLAVVKLNVSKALVETQESVKKHLKYYNEETKEYEYLKAILMGYKGEDGTIYPVYCVNKELPGPEKGKYYITTENLLKNDKIWRIVKNGYPFKSAKEWGLSDEKDVYMITRQAIYCVLGQEKLEYFKAEKDDKQAVAMLKALKELVNIGENGTEKQSDEPLKTEKVGKFVEAGEYYLQQYKVVSTSDFDKYTIEAVKGMPEGAFVSDSKGNEKKVFSRDEDFYIRIPKLKLIKNIDIDIKVSAECRAYLVLDGKSTVDGKQNFAATMGEMATIETEAELKVDVNTAKINILKTDEETKKGIEGVEFELINEKGEKVETKVTDKEGKAEFSNLVQGKYTIVETKANEQYIKLDKKIETEVEFNQTKNVNISNEHKKGNLKVYKVDKDNKKVVLGSVGFELYSIEDKRKVGTYTTDENGEIYIENLRTGKYKLKETKTNKWYNLADEVEVEVKWNETTETEIQNELKKGQVKVIKVDSENKEIKLKDVEFEVLNEKDEVLEKLKTDKNGEALTSKYALRDYKKIYLKEISTNKKYILDDKKIEVNLDTDGVKEMEVKNTKIKGQIKIKKTAADDNIITGEKKGTPLEGVVFEIYDENNKVVEKIKTNKNGEAITSKLEMGEYKIKEISTNEWYYLNNKIFIASIKENDKIVTLNITNEPKNPEIYTEKIGVDRVEVGSETQYDLSMKNSGNTSLDNFTWVDEIPTEYIKVTKFQTGTYNQNLKYNLYYKTNLSNDEHILLMEDLKTTENYEIDFSKELANNEYVTELKLEFGTVDVGFSSNENPHLFAKIKSDLKSETTFTNTAKAFGDFQGRKVEHNSSFKTLVYKLLPKTGF